MGIDHITPPKPVPATVEEGLHVPRTERATRPRPVQPAGEDRWEGHAQQEPQEKPAHAAEETPPEAPEEAEGETERAPESAPRHLDLRV
jgi:hypothetical protein